MRRLAASLTGRVTRVADGDTITILAPDGDRVPCGLPGGRPLPSNTASVGADRRAARTQHKIRLYGSDAQEQSQAFGQNPRGPGADFIFAAILPCSVKISAARRGSK